MKNSAEKTKELNVAIAIGLNELLADYQIYYQNLRGIHWNVKGMQFFALHSKFEEYYTEAADVIDEIAERILTLGGTPLHTFGAYIGNSVLKQEENVSDDREALEVVLSNSQHLLNQLKKVNILASEQEDEGTNDLVSGLISSTEKRIWMLNASLA